MASERKEVTVMDDVWAGDNLAQFQPDPEGFDGCATPPAAAPDGDAADPSWIVWPTSADESAWAANELEMEWQAAAGLARKELQAR